LGTIVERQTHYWAGFIPAWNAFAQPLPFLMFLVCIHAEANRAPFDLAEAEQELVGGYHTEYSSMRFALFFLAEYAGMITTSAVCVALFFGGWHVPWIEWAWPALAGNVSATDHSLTNSVLACIVRAGAFFAKTIAIIFVFMWVRWSLPRFRFDQLMMLAWRALIPISLVLLMGTAVLAYFVGSTDSTWLQSERIGGALALYLLAMNLVLLAGTMVVSAFLPAAPQTNRRLLVDGSRFAHTPAPAWRAQAN
jgi:NADH-quinone oxidoreductase subunit H